MCKTQKSNEQVNTHWDIEILHWFKTVLYRIDIRIGRYSDILVSDRYRFWKSGIEPSLTTTHSLCIKVVQLIEPVKWMDYLGKGEVLTNTDLDRFVSKIWEK